MSEPMSIAQRWVVDFGDAAKQVVLHPDLVADIDGRKFVKLAKSDCATCRLLGLVQSGANRPLSHTSIIERISKLRNEEYPKYCVGYAANSLDLDDKPKGPKKPRADMPAYVTVQAPAIDDGEPVPIVVRLTRPDTALWVQLTVSNLEYLRHVAKSEYVAGVTKRTHPSAKLDAHDREQFRSRTKGVYFHFSGRRKGTYRSIIKTKCKTTRRQRTTTKYFSTPRKSTVVVSELREKAEEFINTQQHTVTLVD
jgi:hypothetical protein